MAVVIVLVVAAVGFIGYKVLGGSHKVDTESMAQHYGMKDIPHTATGMAPPAPGSRGGGMSGGASGGR